MIEGDTGHAVAGTGSVRRRRGRPAFLDEIGRERRQGRRTGEWGAAMKACALMVLGVLTAGCAAWQPEPPCPELEGIRDSDGFVIGGHTGIFPDVELDLTPAQRERVFARLASFGFDPGPLPAEPSGLPPPSYFGPEARRAIARWQAFCGDSSSGHLTEGQVRVLLDDE